MLYGPLGFPKGLFYAGISASFKYIYNEVPGLIS